MVKGIIFFTEPPAQSLYGDVSGWTNMLDKMDVDFYIVIDENGVIPNWEDSRTESYRVDNFTDALTKLAEVHPECDKIKAHSSMSTELKDYTHPTDACYIIGADGATYPIFTEDGGFKIYADNLFAVEVASILQYDRFSKGG